VSLNGLNAQLKIMGQVIDADTKEEIPYVTIGVIKLAKGTVSDEEGRYDLTVNDKNDEVVFSYIGYETKTISAGKLINNSKIELKKIRYTIETVEIIEKRFNPEDKIFGAKNDKRGHSIGFGSTQLGAEIGSAIKIEKPIYIKSVNFKINHAKGDSLIMRVNIYSFENGKIGENLLNENVFIKEKQRTGTITIDMSPYNLILKSDVLLSLEWIRNSDEIGNKGFSFDTKKDKNLRGVYVKYFGHGEFKKLEYKPKLKPSFYFVGTEVISETP
jgi:hypothetical protein